MFSIFKDFLESAQKILSDEPNSQQQEQADDDDTRSSLRVDLLNTQIGASPATDILEDFKKTTSTLLASNSEESIVDALFKSPLGVVGTFDLGTLLQQTNDTGEGTPVKVDPKYYFENFAAGTGLLTKYAIYLSKMSQNNRVLSLKANATGQLLGSIFFETMRYQSEWRDVQTTLSEVPKILQQVEVLSGNIKDTTEKLETVEKLLSEQVNVTVRQQMMAFQEMKKEELKVEEEKYNKDLLAVENKFTKIARELDEQKRRKTEEEQIIEKKQKIQQLNNDIANQIEMYATYGKWATGASAVPKKRVEAAALAKVTLDFEEEEELDSFLGSSSSDPEANKNKDMLHKRGGEEEEDKKVEVLIEDEDVTF